MEKSNKNIAGVILAAGKGSRIGKNKALLKKEEVSFLEVIANNFKQSGCISVTVVCGSEAEEVEKEARRISINCVYNENWQKGQFSTLKTGLGSLDPRVEGVIITPVDHPFATGETYKRLIDEFAGSPNSIVKPEHDGRGGHPIVIPADIIRDILEASDDLTLRDILNLNENRVLRVHVNDPGIIADIDTTEDFKKASSDERCR